MRHDDLFLWLLTDLAAPHYVGQLRLVDAGKGVSFCPARASRRRSPFAK